MKLFKSSLVLLAGTFVFYTASSQNVLINVLMRNSGKVRVRKTAFLEVTINNTDATSFTGLYKLKVQISVPPTIASINLKGHVLPTSWEIISNDGSTITLSNGKDLIAANDARTLLIAIKGEKIGGPSTIAGQILFANGQPPGTVPGVLEGDNPADNSSTSTIKVTR